jgi:hypothetical protein
LVGGEGDGIVVLKSIMENEKLQSNVANLKLQNVSVDVYANTSKGKKLTFEEDLSVTVNFPLISKK